MRKYIELKVKRIIISKKELLFFTALTLLCTYNMLANIVLYYEMPDLTDSIRKLLKYILLFVLLIEIFINDCHNRKKLLYFIVVGILIVCVYISGRHTKLFLTFGLIFCGSDTNFEKIIKALFINIVGWGISIISLCKIGILDDYIYYHRIGESIKIGHSFGFLSYNQLGFMAMAVSMMWVYLRKKCSYMELFAIAIFNYWFYTFHTTTLTLVILVTYLLTYIIVIKMKIFKLRGTFWRFLANTFPAGICISIYALLIAYIKGKISITISFLNTIEHRFEYSAFYLKSYGISLFGKKIEMNSIQDYYYNGASNYIYIDSGYVYAIIAYGLIFTILIIISYTVVFKYLHKTENKKGYIWITTMLIACCVNNFLLNIMFNPILFMLPTVITNLHKKSLKTRRKKFV